MISYWVILQDDQIIIELTVQELSIMLSLWQLIYCAKGQFNEKRISIDRVEIVKLIGVRKLDLQV
ncbi:MAG: hypothetical protein ACO1OT_07830, partial [Heyndrickxia sp.]